MMFSSFGYKGALTIIVLLIYNYVVNNAVSGGLQGED